MLNNLIFFFSRLVLSPRPVFFEALFTENGPIMPDGKGGLTKNPIAWTSIANVVYLEQPAFVGFSYSNTTSDKNTGDAQATADNVAFVNGFLKLYPDYVGRETWFTGESYGGVLVALSSLFTHSHRLQGFTCHR